MLQDYPDIGLTGSQHFVAGSYQLIPRGKKVRVFTAWRGPNTAVGLCQLKDGGASGTTKLQFLQTTGNSETQELGELGILFDDGIYMSNPGTITITLEYHIEL